ncbi:MAG: NUDIX hydrolase [Candidatus Melainabacteria bacterium]|nr:NUDIX hydrolase [Candidatus Melainabacteria bacterium]
MALFTREHTFRSDRIHEGHIINLRVDYLRNPEGREVIRELVEHNGGVTVCCKPDKNSVVLIKQYRYSVDELLYELPAGRIEKGEEPILAAKRELTEETGYSANKWRELVRVYTAPGFCNEMLYMYEATDVILTEQSLDDDEEAEVIVMSLADAWQLVLDGKIRDAKTVAGLGLLGAGK